MYSSLGQMQEYITREQNYLKQIEILKQTLCCYNNKTDELGSGLQVQ